MFSHSSYFLVLLMHMLFTWSLIGQSLFITVFFTRAKVGNIAAMLFFLLQQFSLGFLQN